MQIKRIGKLYCIDLKRCKDFSVRRSDLVLVRIQQNDDKPTESGPATPPVLVLVSSNEEDIKIL
jgi:hypothetical protein